MANYFVQLPKELFICVSLGKILDGDYTFSISPKFHKMPLEIIIELGISWHIQVYEISYTDDNSTLALASLFENMSNPPTLEFPSLGVLHEFRLTCSKFWNEYNLQIA